MQRHPVHEVSCKTEKQILASLDEAPRLEGESVDELSGDSGAVPDGEVDNEEKVIINEDAEDI